MDAPEARYLERDGATLAYQVVGDGAADVVIVGEAPMHFDLCWTDPDIHELFERGATYSRTVYMQPRGFGLSERIRYTPTLEQHADDVVAVMDAVGMRKATLFGCLTSCAPVALVAAREPTRVASLVLFKPIAAAPLMPEAEVNGWTAAQITEYVSGWRAAVARWGSGDTIDMWDPVQATPYNRKLMALLERCSATPAGAASHLEFFLHTDGSDILRAVRVPTRVLRLPSDPEPEAVTRRVAELVPGASYLELPPTPPGASIGEAWIPVWDQIEEAATGARHSVDDDRFLGSVLFTDVVSSTELLANIGDARYRELHASHERQVRLEVERAGGRLVKVIGDGTLSVFGGPTKAVRCAESICRGARDLGIAVRAGVHTGELERTGPDVTGLSVHIGARVGAVAQAGEVLVSRTVHDLVAGSGLSFAPRGDHELKGVPGSWELFALVSAGEQVATLPAEQSLQTHLDRATLQTAQKTPRAMRTVMRVGNAIQRHRAR